MKAILQKRFSTLARRSFDRRLARRGVERKAARGERAALSPSVLPAPLAGLVAEPTALPGAFHSPGRVFTSPPFRSSLCVPRNKTSRPGADRRAEFTPDQYRRVLSWLLDEQCGDVIARRRVCRELGLRLSTNDWVKTFPGSLLDEERQKRQSDPHWNLELTACLIPDHGVGVRHTFLVPIRLILPPAPSPITASAPSQGPQITPSKMPQDDLTPTPGPADDKNAVYPAAKCGEKP